MPLLKFDIIQGRSEEQVRKLLDTTHQAMVQAFDVPSSDRYQKRYAASTRRACFGRHGTWLYAIE